MALLFDFIMTSQIICVLVGGSRRLQRFYLSPLRKSLAYQPAVSSSPLPSRAQSPVRLLQNHFPC